MAPMSVVEQADRLLQEAIDQFSDKKSIMKSEYRNLAESCMICATEHRQGIEERSYVDQAEQAKLYSKHAQKALDAVKKAIEKSS